MEKKTNTKKPPVKEGDKIKLKLTGLGQKGNWMGHYKAYTIFVNADPEQVKDFAVGKEIDLLITKVLPNVGFGTPLEE